MQYQRNSKKKSSCSANAIKEPCFPNNRIMIVGLKADKTSTVFIAKFLLQFNSLSLSNKRLTTTKNT
jgi:hypothetical protein